MKSKIIIYAYEQKKNPMFVNRKLAKKGGNPCHQTGRKNPQNHIQLKLTP